MTWSRRTGQQILVLKEKYQNYAEIVCSCTGEAIVCIYLLFTFYEYKLLFFYNISGGGRDENLH